MKKKSKERLPARRLIASPQRPSAGVVPRGFFCWLLVASLVLVGCSQEIETKGGHTTEHHLSLAQSFLAQGQLQGAVSEAQKALQMEPGNAKAARLVAQAAMTMGSYVEAARYYSEALVADADNDELFSQWIRAEIRAGDIDNALLKLSERKGAYQDSAQYAWLTGRALLIQGYAEAALAQFNIASEKDSVLAEAYIGKAEALLALEKNQQAQQALNTAAELDADNPEISLLLAKVDVSENRWQAAESHYSDALLQVGHYDMMTLHKYVALEGMVKTMVSQGRSQEALRYSQMLADSPQGQMMNQYKNAIDRFRKGDISAAEDQLEEMLDLSPGNSAVSAILGLVKMSKGDYHHAEKLLDIALESGAVAKDAEKILAVTQLKMGKHQQAYDLLSKIVEREPNDASMKTFLALSELYLQKKDIAKKRLDEVLQEKPDHLQAISARAFVDFLDKRYDQSRQRYLKVIKADPSNVLAMQGIMQVNRAAGQSSGQTFTVLVEQIPDVVELRLFQAANLILEKNYDQGIAASVAALEKFPSEARLRNAVASAYAAKAAEKAQGERYELALTFVDKGLTYAPDHVRLTVLKAKLLYQIGGVAKAEPVLVALSKKKTNGIGYLLLGDFYISEKKFSKAISAYEQAWGIVQNNTLGLKLLEARLLANRDIRKSVRHLEQWASAHESETMPKLALAMGYQRAGFNDLAIVHYEQLVEREVNSALVYNNLAWLYHEQGNEQALALAVKAQELAPDDPSVLDTYGWILFHSGEKARALDILKKAHDRAPGHQEIQAHYLAVVEATNTEDTLMLENDGS